MSKKTSEDKGKEGYPWTARQERKIAGGRKTRKFERGRKIEKKSK